MDVTGRVGAGAVRGASQHAHGAQGRAAPVLGGLGGHFVATGQVYCKLTLLFLALS